MFDFFKSIFDFDFQVMFQNMFRYYRPKALGKLVPASVLLVRVDKETGEQLEDDGRKTIRSRKNKRKIRGKR